MARYKADVQQVVDDLGQAGDQTAFDQACERGQRVVAPEQQAQVSADAHATYQARQVDAALADLQQQIEAAKAKAANVEKIAVDRSTAQSTDEHGPSWSTVRTIDGEPPTRTPPSRELGLRDKALEALESLENIKRDPVGDVNSQPSHNHYAAARREAAGEVVARRRDGRPFSHIGDLQQAYDGLARIENALAREIANPSSTMTERGLGVLLKKHSEVRALLNRVGGFLNEIGQGRFPPYHTFPPGA